MEKSYFLDKRGQSLIEYVLLMAVIATLTVSLFKSNVFQRFFGENSNFFQAMQESIESNYRYGLLVENPETDNPHPSFFAPDGRSRFFSGRTAYPKQ